LSGISSPPATIAQLQPGPIGYSLLHVFERLNAISDEDTLLDVLIQEAIALVGAQGELLAYIPLKVWSAISIFAEYRPSGGSSLKSFSRQKISDLLSSSLDQQITLQEIAALLVPSVADYCRIVLVDEQQQITDIAINHVEPQRLPLVQALYEQYKDRANSLYGVRSLLETGKSDLISTVSGPFLERLQDNPELLRIIQALGLQSYMGVPLIARNKIIGAITLSSIQAHQHYAHADLAFAADRDLYWLRHRYR
jgi:hypothetical protein